MQNESCIYNISRSHLGAAFFCLQFLNLTNVPAYGIIKKKRERGQNSRHYIFTNLTLADFIAPTKNKTSKVSTVNSAEIMTITLGKQKTPTTLQKFYEAKLSCLAWAVMQWSIVQSSLMRVATRLAGTMWNIKWKMKIKKMINRILT